MLKRLFLVFTVAVFSESLFSFQITSKLLYLVICHFICLDLLFHWFLHFSFLAFFIIFVSLLLSELTFFDSELTFLHSLLSLAIIDFNCIKNEVFSEDFVIFTEEILNGKLHSLRSVSGMLLFVAPFVCLRNKLWNTL